MTAAEEDGSWEEVVSAAAYLGAQPAAEKIPVNFLLFTESPDFARSGCADGDPINGGCIPPGDDLDRAAVACVSFGPNEPKRAQSRWETP
jgi:hypothetical protein